LSIEKLRFSVPFYYKNNGISILIEKPPAQAGDNETGRIGNP